MNWGNEPELSHCRAKIKLIYPEEKQEPTTVKVEYLLEIFLRKDILKKKNLYMKSHYMISYSSE